MPKKKTRLDRFSDLTWNDIEEWADGKIVSRGKDYQRKGYVTDLVSSSDGNRRSLPHICLCVSRRHSTGGGARSLFNLRKLLDNNCH